MAHLRRRGWRCVRLLIGDNEMHSESIALTHAQVETLRTMKAQLMGSAVRPGAFYIGWAWTPMRVVRLTDALIVCYLSTQRTGLKNAFEGD